MYFKKPNSSFYDLQLENQTEQKKKKNYSEENTYAPSMRFCGQWIT